MYKNRQAKSEDKVGRRKEAYAVKRPCQALACVEGLPAECTRLLLQQAVTGWIIRQCWSVYPPVPVVPSGRAGLQFLESYMPKRIVRHRRSALVRQSHRCYYCTCPMWDDNAEQFMARYGVSRKEADLCQCTAEHLKAKSEGGTDAASNIAAACRRCNQTRHRASAPLDP